MICPDDIPMSLSLSEDPESDPSVVQQFVPAGDQLRRLSSIRPNIRDLGAAPFPPADFTLRGLADHFLPP